MSHTREYIIDGKTVTTIGNSDWGGDVRIRFPSEHGVTAEITLPGELLLELGKAVALETLRRELEEFLDQKEAAQ